ncbi:MAG: hypothetical protein WKG06_26590 [Segetibacter sp.]
MARIDLNAITTIIQEHFQRNNRDAGGSSRDGGIGGGSRERDNRNAGSGGRDNRNPLNNGGGIGRDNRNNNKFGGNKKRFQ